MNRFCDPNIPYQGCRYVKICISRTFVGVLRKYENLEMQLLAKSVQVFDLSMQFA